MEVEIYIGYGYTGGSGGSWTTDYITVPDTLYGHPVLINDFIDNWMHKYIDDYKDEYESIAFWGIYHIPPLEEETD